MSRSEDTWPESRIATLRSYHAAGKSTAEIGRLLGVSKNAIVGKCRRIGLDQREGCVRTIGQEKLEAAQALIRQGLTAVEIAERVGIHDDTVRGIRKRMGLAPPSRQTRIVRTLPPLPSELIVKPPPPRPPPAPRPVMVRPVLVAEPVRLDRSRTCENLFGERRKMVACGKPAVLGKSWCPECCGKVFIPKRDRQEIAA